jgi:hypothetical protein
VILKNAAVYRDLILTNQPSLVIALVILFVAGRTGVSVASALRLWPVWLPVIVALCAYSFVLVDQRYVAVFFIVLWMTLLASVRLTRAMEFRKLIVGVTCGLLFTLGMPLALSAAGDMQESMHQRHVLWDIARKLQAMGVNPGDRVGRIGGLHRVEWARLVASSRDRGNSTEPGGIFLDLALVRSGTKSWRNSARPALPP